MDKYKNDPTNEYETVKEYTKEDLFDIYANENELPEVVREYVLELEDKVRLLTKKLKENGN